MGTGSTLVTLVLGSPSRRKGQQFLASLATQQDSFSGNENRENTVIISSNH